MEWSGSTAVGSLLYEGNMMTAEEYIINEENWTKVVKYSLCWKRTHPGSDKRYPYIKYPGGKWEYVPEEKRDEVEKNGRRSAG